MSWTALVPLKQAGTRKTRLAGCLGPAERHALSDRMASHVLEVLHECAAIGAVHVLAPEPVPGVGWIRDLGRGLNAELSEAVAALGGVDLLILHADLPLLSVADLLALLDVAGEAGCAMATDRAGTGTNAMALRRGVGVAVSFGPDSLARHREAARVGGHEVRVLRRDGLALDVDVAADLEEAARRGFVA